MKLDNLELSSQRTKLLLEIHDLLDNLDTLSENLEYVYVFKKIPGIFFRVKDIIYMLFPKNIDINSVAGTLSIDKDLPSITFKPLENESIEYYNTKEGKLKALAEFKEYICTDPSIILHELVHIDDERNGITKPDDKSVSNNPYVYYNHPAEIRAYTQQNLYIALNEIQSAIQNGEIKTKDDLRKFCQIYKKYKDIFTKTKRKNNFVYWKPSTFKDYLENLKFITDTISSTLPE